MSTQSKRCKGEVHKYKRYSANSKSRRQTDVFHCIRCPHYIKMEFVIGRSSECWRCGKPFIMTERTLQLKPNCGCKSSKQPIKSQIETQTKNELLDLLMKKIS